MPLEVCKKLLFILGETVVPKSPKQIVEVRIKKIGKPGLQE